MNAIMWYIGKLIFLAIWCFFAVCGGLMTVSAVAYSADRLYPNAATVFGCGVILFVQAAIVRWLEVEMLG